MKMDRKKITLIALIVFLLASGLLLYFGLKDQVKHMMDTKDYLKVQGQVADVEDFETLKDGTKTYAVTYTYTVSSTNYRYTVDYGVKNPPAVNDKANIKHDANNPVIMVVDDFKGNLTYLILGTTLLVLTALGFIFVVKRKEMLK